jgi:hypothetical protein
MVVTIFAVKSACAPLNHQTAMKVCTAIAYEPGVNIKSANLEQIRTHKRRKSSSRRAQLKDGT